MDCCDFSNNTSDLGHDTAIFDVDGTLSDVSHRRHYVTGGAKDWDTFTDKMVDDPPHRDVCLLAELLGDHPLVNQGAIKLFIFSGRPETHRAQTEEWLRIHCRSLLEKAEGLLMRAAGDYRSDVIVKEEFLDFIIKSGYNPRFVVDDRPSVCDMWKRRGITLLRHDNGEWDMPEKTWPHGELHLMVGPSGAGKSSFIQKQFFFKADLAFPPSALLSTDSFRAEMTGDMESQAANDQVFFAVHAIAQARLNSGLNAIIDGTNLRSKNRREYRNLLPADGKIHYWVIDRPLEEKHRDAGWRDKIVIKDEKLVDRHHRIFQAVKRDVLRGDDDPRVTVHDMRS